MLRDELNRELIELIPRLRRFARVLTRNMSDADDVVQATLEKVMHNIDQWQDGTRFDRWAFAIARNLWIDDRRSARNKNQHIDASELAEIEGDDGRLVTENRSRDQMVKAAVDSLPEEQRVLVGLVILEGFSYREAADMLDIPIGTVMSRISRAKIALAERLKTVGAH